MHSNHSSPQEALMIKRIYLYYIRYLLQNPILKDIASTKTVGHYFNIQYQ
jgi:hypothetical protein